MYNLTTTQNDLKISLRKVILSEVKCLNYFEGKGFVKCLIKNPLKI